MENRVIGRSVLVVAVTVAGDLGAQTPAAVVNNAVSRQIGRASWRGRGEILGGGGSLKKKKKDSRASTSRSKTKSLLPAGYPPSTPPASVCNPQAWSRGLLYRIHSQRFDMSSVSVYSRLR